MRQSHPRVTIQQNLAVVERVTAAQPEVHGSIRVSGASRVPLHQPRQSSEIAPAGLHR